MKEKRGFKKELKEKKIQEKKVWRIEVINIRSGCNGIQVKHNIEAFASHARGIHWGIGMGLGLGLVGDLDSSLIWFLV